MNKNIQKKILELGSKIAEILQEDGNCEYVIINQDEVCVTQNIGRAIPNAVGSWEKPIIAIED